MPTVAHVFDSYVGFAVFTHRRNNAKTYHWCECINNIIDPKIYLDVIYHANLIRTDDTTLHLGFVTPENTIHIVHNLTGMDNLKNRSEIWNNCNWFQSLETSYAQLMEQLGI